MTDKQETERGWFERMSVVSGWGFLASAGLWGVGLWRFAWEAWWEPLVLVALVPVMWALADLTTGVVHWALDHYGSPETPWIGPHFVAPFREHHTDPGAITREAPMLAVGSAAMVALPLMAALMVATRLGWAGFVISGAVGVWVCATVLTNLFHRWAHAPEPGRMITWMQRAGLILSPEEHARHHAPPHDHAYCITCGWLNPWLERGDVFGRLERALASVGVHAAGEPHRAAHP